AGFVGGAAISLYMKDVSQYVTSAADRDRFEFVTGEGFPEGGPEELFEVTAQAPPRDLSRRGFLTHWCEEGFLLPLPYDFELCGRDHERACFVALMPVEVGGPDGSRRLCV